MCGILGSINAAFSPETLGLIKHRGPDSRGTFRDKLGGSDIMLGHTRLAIVDLSSAGDQPMVTEDGEHVIIYNGEIYNHEDLKRKMPDIVARGHSDTETALNYMAKFGIEGVKDFNGIFAFVFLDRAEKKMYLARDPYGVKPLYYSVVGDRFVASSEIKTILEALPGLSGGLDDDGLYQFLRLRFTPAPLTLYRNIRKLEPGYYLEVPVEDPSSFRKVFYAGAPKSPDNIGEAEALERYGTMLDKAVDRQLMADVPVVSLLSGGVDSALLSFLAQKHAHYRMHTFTAGYDIKSFSNELEIAKETADFLGTVHHEVVLDQRRFFENLQKFVSVIEEPVGAQSIFPLYYLAETIHAAGFKTAFSGQGVDEMWGGYRKYNVQGLIEAVSSSPARALGPLGNTVRDDKLRRAFRSISGKDRVARFIGSYSIFDTDMVRGLSGDLFGEEHYEKLYRLVAGKLDLLGLKEKPASLAMMAVDARMDLSDDLLAYTDKISMRHSLEIRVPYLDIELADFVESLPLKFKTGLFTNKKLHKELARRFLPESVITREKRGFTVPVTEWFRGDHMDRVYDEMFSPGSRFAEYFSRDYVKGLIGVHRKGKTDFRNQIYSLMVLHYWMKEFL